MSSKKRVWVEITGHTVDDVRSSLDCIEKLDEQGTLDGADVYNVRFRHHDFETNFERYFRVMRELSFVIFSIAVLSSYMMSYFGIDDSGVLCVSMSSFVVWCCGVVLSCFGVE